MSQPLLGRCKDCDYALFVAGEQTGEVRDADSFSEIRQPGVAYHVGNSGIFARCDKGHRVFLLRRIEGTYSKDHKCDARCLNAKGWKCTCSCRGANHGRGYAVVHEAHTEKEERLLGEVGKHIVGEVKIVRAYIGGNATIYTFMTLDDTAKLTWFAPNYADPHFEQGEILRIRAKVKRHENDPNYGKSTVVTYVELWPRDTESE